jgi:hypothetical protein
LALPGDALLDKAASEISVDKAALGSLDGLTQALVGYSLASDKPRKPFRFENFALRLTLGTIAQ